MLKRMGMPVAAIVAIAVIVAVVAARQADTSYTSTCLVRFSLPLTSGTGTSYFDVNQTVAGNELDRALRGPVYVQAASAAGTDPAGLAARTSIQPGTRVAYFAVTITNKNAQRSKTEAGAVCDALRGQLIHQRAAQRDAEASQLDAQLVDLANRRELLRTTPDRSDVDNLELTSVDTAYAANLNALATTLARPADVISSTAAGDPVATSSDNTAQNLRVAAGAIPLTCFLVFVIAEQSSKRRTAKAVTA